MDSISLDVSEQGQPEISDRPRRKAPNRSTVDLGALDADCLLIPRELAALTGMSESYLAKCRMERGRGPLFIKIGHRVFYRVAAVRDWLRSNEVASTLDCKPPS